jgi:hypothetical protein
MGSNGRKTLANEFMAVFDWTGLRTSDIHKEVMLGTGEQVPNQIFTAINNFI